MHKVPRNEHYQRDIKNILELNRSVLLALGVWPKFDGDKSICEKINKFLRISISYFLLYFSLVPGALYWIFEKRARARLRTIPIMLYGFMSLGKYYSLIIYESQIRRCLKHLEEDWRNVNGMNARKVMLESARTGKRLVIISAVFLYSSGITLRTILPLSKGKIVTPENITIRPLPYPTHSLLFDAQSSPIYEVVFVMHCLSGLVTMSISVSICGLIIIFVTHTCGQLKVLIDLIKDLVEKKQRDEYKVNKKLAIIVDHQTRIRSFLQLVESTLQQMCFIEITGVTVIICVLCYCILMEWENSNALALCSYFMALSGMIINMLMFCYTGEQLITQAEKVAVTSCELEWYRLPDNKARGIILVMIASNMPTKITAGKLFDLSFRTFGDAEKLAITCNELKWYHFQAGTRIYHIDDYV
ncbi:odorant receptor 22c-like isoform X1 [Harpegnathos saltator]|uniref:odorant receptor 22c-like isoform X1 n=1 Tax=Harpegnathos saltator TaxID=610380 RepID=UPI00058C1F15|nr:odorant receptor 22c-like isoform X1 [Harpegnathos saltator]